MNNVLYKLSKNEKKRTYQVLSIIIENAKRYLDPSVQMTDKEKIQLASDLSLLIDLKGKINSEIIADLNQLIPSANND